MPTHVSKPILMNFVLELIDSYFSKASQIKTIHRMVSAKPIYQNQIKQKLNG
jgi:hypothetical protein